MKKQTAVEWLFAHLLPFLEFSNPKEREHFRKCLAEAKAMEKEQIMEGYMKAKLEHIDTLGLNAVKNKIIKDTEQYFQETYGGDK